MSVQMMLLAIWLTSALYITGDRLYSFGRTCDERHIIDRVGALLMSASWVMLVALLVVILTM